MKLSNEKPFDYFNQMEVDILAAMKKPNRWYWISLAIAAAFMINGIVIMWGLQIRDGLGWSGINNPVGWGVYITDMVFWIGIGHAGTLISAVLFLVRAKFRSLFSRTAEAMTIFALCCAGLFPFIHVGRPWWGFWLFPYPNQRGLWANFKSPLEWDVFAISTYVTISAVFFFVGLIPDFAILKRYTTGIRRIIYSVLSLGWQGTRRQWKHYRQLYKFLAALATPLVISVHSIVSWDFAMSIIPGWHTTIFAPYFVAGAIFSGVAMVITLMVPMRKIFNLQKYITLDHFEKLAKLLILTGLIVTYSYAIEAIMAFYNGNVYEVGIFKYRGTGDFKFFYWLMIFCNCVSPLVLLFKKVRRNLYILFIISLLVNVGMWLERFNIIVLSLAKDYLPYSWAAGTYCPTYMDFSITLGSFGLFFTLFLLFVKLLPVISITELKEEVE